MLKMNIIMTLMNVSKALIIHKNPHKIISFQIQININQIKNNNFPKTVRKHCQMILVMDRNHNLRINQVMIKTLIKIIKK